MGDAAEAPIPFKPDQKSGLEELAGGSPSAINVVVDALGAVMKRPGLTDYKGRTQTASSNRVVGIYETNKGKLIGVREHAPFRHVIGINDTTEVDLSNAPGEVLRGTSRPVFAETEDRVVIAGGDLPLKLDPLGITPTALVGGTPPKSTHMIANSSRLLSNDIDQFPWLTWFSDVSGQPTGGYDAWSVATGPSTGSAQSFSSLQNREPELVLVEGAGQVFSIGRSRMQIWLPDPQAIYARESSREFGCAAPYSIVKVDGNFAWLDQKRHFVVSDGRTSVDISSPAIQRTLNAMTTVSDCFAWRYMYGDDDVLVWTFPTDGRTFAYHAGSGWMQWQGRQGNAWTQCPILSHVLRVSTNENVVGTTDGRIALVDPNSTTDFGDPIVAEVVTGFDDRGTSRMKINRAVRISMRRGESGQSNEPVGFLWWRNDLGGWQGGIPVGFGTPDDRMAVVRLRSVGGTYRRRQWKWTFSGPDRMALADVVEEYEVLGS